MLEAILTLASAAWSIFYTASKVSFVIYAVGTLLPRTLEAAKTWFSYMSDWFAHATEPLHDVVSDSHQLAQYHWSLLPIILKSHTNLVHIDGHYVAALYKGILTDSDPIVSSIGKAVLKIAATDPNFSVDFTSYLGWYVHNVQLDQINTYGSIYHSSTTNPHAQYILQHKHSLYIYNEEGHGAYHNHIAITPVENTAYNKTAVKADLICEHTAQVMQALFHNYARPYGYEHGEEHLYHKAVREMLKNIATLGSVQLNCDLEATDNLALARIIVDKAILHDDGLRYIMDSYLSADASIQADIEIIAKFTALHASHTYTDETMQALAPIAYYWEHEITPRLAKYIQDYSETLIAYRESIEQYSEVESWWLQQGELSI